MQPNAEDDLMLRNQARKYLSRKVDPLIGTAGSSKAFRFEILPGLDDFGLIAGQVPREGRRAQPGLAGVGNADGGGWLLSAFNAGAAERHPYRLDAASRTWQR